MVGLTKSHGLQKTHSFISFARAMEFISVAG